LALISISHITSGFIAVLVGFTSSFAIVFQAATTAGADAAQISSWLWALGIGMGLSSIGFSLFYRVPILTAWSTPGAALLVTALDGYTMAQAIGVFIFSSALLVLTGVTGVFSRLMRHIPPALAAAMLAGVLVQFGLQLFGYLETDLLLVGSMLILFVLLRRIFPLYAIPLTLLLAVALTLIQGRLSLEHLELQFSTPVWTTPSFSWQAMLGVGIPLYIVSLTSQNIPGLAVLNANGFRPAAGPIIGGTGFLGVVLAPFGGFSYNLAAITAAICMGAEAGADPKQRYWAAVWAGIFYLLTGLFGATVVSLFVAFPVALVTSIAGLALLGTISQSLASGLKEDESREAALMTFLMTASGVSLFGIASAFWGLLLGLAVYYWVKRS